MLASGVKNLEFAKKPTRTRGNQNEANDLISYRAQTSAATNQKQTQAHITTPTPTTTPDIRRPTNNIPQQPHY